MFRNSLDSLLAQYNMRTGEIRETNDGTRTVSIYAYDGEGTRDILKFQVTEAGISEFGQQVGRYATEPQRETMDGIVDAYAAAQAANATRR